MRISDWSSDVCSSDLRLRGIPLARHNRADHGGDSLSDDFKPAALFMEIATAPRWVAAGHACSRRPVRQRASGGAVEHVIGGHDRLYPRYKSEEQTSELQAPMRITYAVFCW